MKARSTLVAGAAALTLLLATPAVAAEPQPTVADPGPAASYIVQFTPGSDRAAEVSKAKGLGMKVTYEYTTALKGMAVQANAGQLRALQANPNVQAIEADGIVTIDDTLTQLNPTWGLDRTDQRNLSLDSSYTYSDKAGTGVTAYIIDTGIRATHSDLGGRVLGGTDAFTAITDGNGTNDCNGHGTHVAGTVGGTKWGMAKNVKLVPVRVLDCSGSGSNSGVIAGVDWVAANAKKPAVANMSLGGGAYSLLDTAVNNAVAKGVVMAVAAGNSNANACNYSPARAGSAITVGATTSTDARASYSNFGTCLDIFAPGSSITSSWITDDSATNTISGTSMATPHVAGAAALYLAENPTASPQQVRDFLVTDGTTGKVTSPGTGSPNVLLFTGTIAPPVAGAPTITSITPTSGPTITTSVTITGTNLKDPSLVTFTSGSGTVTATVTSSTDTSISTTVPKEATSGPITVTNTVGSASASFTVLSAPAAPTITSATSPTSGRATVRWAQGSNGGSPLTSQQLVAYRVVSGVIQPSPATFTVSTTATSATVSLVRGATYQFEVVVANTYGSAKSSLSGPVRIR